MMFDHTGYLKDKYVFVQIIVVFLPIWSCNTIIIVTGSILTITDLNAMGLYKFFIKITINKIAMLCLVTAIEIV